MAVTELNIMANSHFKQLQILCEVDFCLPQEILSLTENNQFRTSQIHKASKSYITYKNEISNTTI